MLSSPASTPILDFSPLTGLLSPLIFLTEASVLTPTIRTSPSLFAVSRHFTCPRCSMSKTPLVVTIFLFCFLSFRAIWASWLIVFILFFVIFNYPLCSINQVLCKIIVSYLIFFLILLFKFPGYMGQLADCFYLIFCHFQLSIVQHQPSPLQNNRELPHFCALRRLQ